MTLLVNSDFESDFNSHAVQLPGISVVLSIISYSFSQYVWSSINGIINVS